MRIFSVYLLCKNWPVSIYPITECSAFLAANRKSAEPECVWPPIWAQCRRGVKLEWLLDRISFRGYLAGSGCAARSPHPDQDALVFSQWQRSLQYWPGPSAQSEKAFRLNSIRLFWATVGITSQIRIGSGWGIRASHRCKGYVLFDNELDGFLRATDTSDTRPRLLHSSTQYVRTTSVLC